MKKIFGFILTMIGIAMAILSLILTVKVQASASIIVGADGPTSIFVAGKIGGTWAVIGIPAGIILLASGVVMIARKNKFKVAED